MRCDTRGRTCDSEGKSTDEEIESSSIGSSFIVSDHDDILTLEQFAVVDSEIRHIREARADIADLSIAYLWGLPQARVHARVMSKAISASGAEWSDSFNDILRHHSPVRASFDDLPKRSRGLCAACNRHRWLSKQLVLSDSSILHLGRTCAARALVAHTLLHAQSACMQMLDDTPIRQLKAFEKNAVRALGSVLDAADDAAEITDAVHASYIDSITSDVMNARASLGFTVSM